jgi:WXG100 family type VII secretion target
MSAPTVRSDYDQLKTVQSSFRAQADAVSRTTMNIKSILEKLQGGDWIGEGAQKFFQEMNDQVMPSVARLQQALTEAERASGVISQTMKTAEDESSAVFKI